MKKKSDLPGLAATAIACRSMENTYKRLGAILVTVVGQAGKGQVQDTDQALLAIYESIKNVQYFEYLEKSSAIDHQILMAIQFGEGPDRSTLRGETATPSTRAMAALKEWNDKYGVKRNHTVEIGGVKYVIGGKTSAQKSLGRPDNQGLWCLVGSTGHYVQLHKKEGAEEELQNYFR